MGEPAGIGGEIALTAWLRRAPTDCPFFLIDDPDRLRGLADRLGLDVPITTIADPCEVGTLFASALPVLPHPLAVAVEPGHPNPVNAQAVAAAITRAVALAQQGRVRAVVTNPIHKAVMSQGDFDFPGHTEYLAHLTGRSGFEVMMLACPCLRVVPVTVHVALAQAIRDLNEERIVAVGTITAGALTRDFGIIRPRLAVAGLNPHAGEDGRMGGEDAAIIAPAVARLQAAGIDAKGPLPADTLFHPAARAGYDAALCMYHDQALIPIKTIDFAGGVNVTLNLPIVRTSPDHGTAFGIAGTGTADPTSLLAALRMADQIASHRVRADA